MLIQLYMNRNLILTSIKVISSSSTDVLLLLTCYLFWSSGKWTEKEEIKEKYTTERHKNYTESLKKRRKKKTYIFNDLEMIFIFFVFVIMSQYFLWFYNTLYLNSISLYWKISLFFVYIIPQNTALNCEFLLRA